MTSRLPPPLPPLPRGGGGGGRSTRGLLYGSELRSGSSNSSGSGGVGVGGGRRSRRNQSRSTSSFRPFTPGLVAIASLLLLRSFQSSTVLRRSNDNDTGNINNGYDDHRHHKSSEKNHEYNNINNVTITTSTSGIGSTRRSFTTTISSTARNSKIVDSKNVLFLIFCGGPSGSADLQAILETWGRTITKVIIMTNTPDDLRPILASQSLSSSSSSSSASAESEQKVNSNKEEAAKTLTSPLRVTPPRKVEYWKVYNTSTMDGGGKRRPFQSWQEIVQELEHALKDDPSIQYVVRTDSDTWWNTRLLFDQLSKSSSFTSSPSFSRHREPTQFSTSSPSSPNGRRHHTYQLPQPDEPYMVGQFHPLVDFRWNRSVSGREMTGLHQYDGVMTSTGQDAYLTGGAGVILTHEAIRRLVSCFSNTTSMEKMTDIGLMTASSTISHSNQILHSRRRRLRSANDQEDVWSSRMAYVCNVTLKRHDGMYQSGRKFWKVPTSLSIHRAVGDGRKGYVHPRYYETILFFFRIVKTMIRWLIGCTFVGSCVAVAVVVHPKISNKEIQ